MSSPLEGYGASSKVEKLPDAYIFLASDASSIINGQVLYVDGDVLATL